MKSGRTRIYSGSQGEVRKNVQKSTFQPKVREKSLESGRMLVVGIMERDMLS